MSIHKVVLVLFLAVTLTSSGLAQGVKARNDSVFVIVERLINHKEPDSLYGMLNEGFKAKMNKEVFTGILKNNLFPLGGIKEHSFIALNGETSSYKATCNAVTLEFRLSTEPSGLISGLRFLPYKEPVPWKTEVAKTNNKLQTVFDKRIDTIARDYINKVTAVGLSIGILYKGNVYYYGYGEMKKGSGKIPDEHAVFEIGSVTKTFTATLLAYFVVEGKVQLSDPITKYLPDSVAANKELQGITLQMLSNHTSGLPRLPDNLFSAATDMRNPYKDYTEKKLYTYLKHCKTESKPGEKYAYSNLAVGLLGNILGHVGGEPYEQMVKEVICNRIGMVHTYMRGGESGGSGLVNVYNTRGEEIQMWDLGALAGAGCIRSDVRDMTRYVEANMHLDNNPLMRETALTHKITYNKEVSVGLGWHFNTTIGPGFFWHGGATAGCRSFVAFIPDYNVSVVLLANSDEDVEEAGLRILKLLQ